VKDLKVWLPKRIETLCKRKHLSYYRLSELSGVSRGSLSQILNAATIPGMDTMLKIVDGFEMSEGEFFDDSHKAPLSGYDRRILTAFHRLGKQEQEVMLNILERADRGWKIK